jgi:N-acetylglucosaminyldiphosphoundecaprenol N-acetyl-beta-D-mannosaminyltransferase
MKSDNISILGVLISNLSMDEVIDEIFKRIDGFKDKDVASQLATLNVDFLVNSHSWSNDRSRHPELLNILRCADIVTADGMPIVWLSKLIGSPLKERVTGADLVPALAQKAAERGKSIYFLGGREDTGRQAAQILKNRFPELKIAGIDAPYVNTHGKALADSSYQDARILNDINRSKADILLIGFGNPKQEIWFKMNCMALKTPFSIGVGGVYSFISGSTKRAPQWVQKIGMEWIFRITQDPWRLWKRYLLGLLKFTYMALPVIFYYRYRMIRDWMLKDIPENVSFSYHNSNSRIQLRLPRRLTQASVNVINEKLEGLINSCSHLILDLSQTSFIDPYGLGFLTAQIKNLEKRNSSVYFIGANKQVMRIFKINRLWDAFKYITFNTIEDALQKIIGNGHMSTLHVLRESLQDAFQIELHGRLDVTSVSKLDAASIVREIGDRDCLFNLSRLDFIDSSGLAFLVKIQNHMSIYNRTPILYGISENIFQMFHIAGLSDLFRITQNATK